jgi:hypothetical protein
MAYFEQTKLADDNGNVISPATETGVLQRIFNILASPLGYDKSQQRQRVTAVVESGTVTTVTTVTTCSTVTNLSTIDALQGRIQVYGANMSAWSDCVRARIT